MSLYVVVSRFFMCVCFHGAKERWRKYDLYLKRQKIPHLGLLNIRPKVVMDERFENWCIGFLRDWYYFYDGLSARVNFFANWFLIIKASTNFASVDAEVMSIGCTGSLLCHRFIVLAAAAVFRSATQILRRVFFPVFEAFRTFFHSCTKILKIIICRNYSKIDLIKNFTKNWKRSLLLSYLFFLVK